MAIIRPRVEWQLTVADTLTDRSLHITIKRFDGTVYEKDLLLDAGVYFPDELAEAVYAMLDSQVDSSLYGSFGVDLERDGKLHVTNFSHTYQLVYGSGMLMEYLGGIISTGNVYDGVPYTAAEFSATASNPLANVFVPPCAVFSDSKDYFERPDSVVTVAQSGRGLIFTEGEHVRRRVVFDYLPPWYTFTSREGIGDAPYNTAIQRWWANGMKRFRYISDLENYDGEDTPWLMGEYYLDSETVAKFQPERSRGIELYRVDIRMRKFI